MADQRSVDQRHGIVDQRHGGEGRHAGEDAKRYLQEKSPPASKAVAVAMLFPVGGILLALSGLTLAGTVIGLVVTTPLFVIFSPVLVPAAIVVGLAVAGFLSSGAFGLTAVTSLAWIVNYLRGGRGAEDVRDLGSSMQEQMEHVKRRMAEAAGHVGQKTKDAGQGIQNKAAHEGGGRN